MEFVVGDVVRRGFGFGKKGQTLLYNEFIEGYMGISAPSNYASSIVLYVNLMYLNFVRGGEE